MKTYFGDWYQIKINWNVILDYNTLETWNYTSALFDVKSGDVITITTTWWWPGRANNVNLTLYMSKNDAALELTPRELKSLWNLATWTLYWRHTNHTYYWGIMLSKETTATTGSITLWNAVGYIKVNLNWEIVKIPYYNE